MPGCLIPEDLDRLLAGVADPFVWAEEHLLASPGAIVARGGDVFRIPTLVPAVKAGGSCIFLTVTNRCGIHEKAPFGCAYFDCKSDARDQSLMAPAMRSVMQDWRDGGLYSRIWQHLDGIGKRQAGPEVLRERMREKLNG